MRKFGLTLAAGILLLAGCCPLAGPARTFLDSVGSEYSDYVAGDSTLTDDEKRIRITHVQRFEKAVNEANK